MEREVFDLDVLYVGAGPATLASAYHLNQKFKSDGNEISIGIIEKAKDENDGGSVLYSPTTSQNLP